LLLTTRQINALIGANFAEWLSAFQESQCHDAMPASDNRRATELRQLDDQQISLFLQSGP